MDYNLMMIKNFYHTDCLIIYLLYSELYEIP